MGTKTVFKAGALKQQYEYKNFLPHEINKNLEVTNADILKLLSEADRKIGELNAYSRLIPNVDFFIHMHITKESVKSGKIEGTKTEFDEALLQEEEIQPDKRDDWKEVRNYTRAMNYAVEKLNSLPLSMRLLNETHAIILDNVRGQSKLPGEIRRSQNWIGGSSLKDAFFIPPSHDELPRLLSDLEKFIHNEELAIPQLIKVALAHYQFETIHPYLYGNGRLGRLLITLFFVDKKILTKPTLYLSDFFEKHRSSYYDALTMVRVSNDLDSWFKFFLTGVIETAVGSINTFERILEIQKSCEVKILGLGKRSKSAHQLLQKLYSNPIVDAKWVGKTIHLTHPSVNSLLEEFQKLGILREVTGFKRNRLFEFSQYVSIFK